MNDDSLVAALEARAAQPPLRPRERLWIDARVGAGPHEIGSIEPALGERLVIEGLPVRRSIDGWYVTGDIDADSALDRIARWLDAERLCSRWRDELLAVTSPDGRPVARIERAAARALGIATSAVHLVGRRADGAFWVQQRALDKAVDPGLWDTLMGGLVTAAESIADTLARETHEEAGLAIADLEDVAACDRLTIRRPVDDGYMIEHIEVFEARMPAGLAPRNLDGEVERFACVDPTTLRGWLAEDRFTLEAALILARRLGVRGAVPTGGATPARAIGRPLP
jgi:8-oxo-dGTP pyrophosphatase MutT (NUDIX family)